MQENGKKRRRVATKKDKQIDKKIESTHTKTQGINFNYVFIETVQYYINIYNTYINSFVTLFRKENSDLHENRQGRETRD